MRTKAMLLCHAALVAYAMGVVAASAQTPPTDEKMIASAISAAPAAIGKGASVVAMEADGKMRTLRTGTNAFTCMPDNPATPGHDPMCMDKNAVDWVHAWVAKKPPAAGKVGFMYMLEGEPTRATPTLMRPSPSRGITGSRPGPTS